MTILNRMRLAFEAVVLLVFVYAAWTATTFPNLAAQFPLTIAIAGIVMATTALVVDVYRIRRGKSVLPTEILDASSRIATAESNAETSAMIRQTIPYVLWIAGFLAAVWILTFPGAVVVFLTVFLTRQGGVRLRSALLAGVIVMVVLMTVVNLMDMVLPASIWAQL